MIGHLGGISYWEGACEIIDAQGHTIGEAYVELTGYAKELGSALQ
jgi:predicted secreted hydrolase